ncbi:Plasmodium vivax Vir protein, putative [Plasmodium vivax]|uniref:Vir protein, putative n=1 Tax=Plasmodium vivax TaxID=5855 RepID=A0A1G4HB51_PLAVI|nr:Plasmodium vivax Vir protein, putative [Plasmodium vivax]
MTGTKAPAPKLEDESKKVGLDEMYKEFFSKKDTPKNNNYCDSTDVKIQTNTQAKQLCSKLVYHLENISKEQKPIQTEHCSYLRYWLYDKIEEIQKKNSEKTSTIPYFKYLIDAWSKVNNEKLNKICVSPKVENVTLKELKDRKYTYIYFKNLDKIHKVSTSKNTADCSKYLTYLQSLSSLHEKYRQNQCVYILWAPDPVDYFPCSNKDKLSYLTSGLQNCKDGKEPYSTPQTSSALTASRSGTGASTSLSAKTGSAGARGLPGSSGTGGTARAPALAAAPVQAKPASTLGQGQANRAQLSTAQPSVGGALTQLGGRTAQLAQSPPGGGSETLIANGDMVTALTGVAPASSGFSEKASEMLKSDYFRHTLVGATVFAVLAFVFFFFKSTSLGSNAYTRKKKRRGSENNYYENYEEQLSAYGSQPSVADSQMSDVYLPYQSRRDSYY